MKKLSSNSADAPQRKTLLDHLEKRMGSSQGNYPEFQFYCPFCATREGSESSKRKLGVNVAKGTCYCFRCEYSASLRGLLSDLNGGRLTAIEEALLRREYRPVADLSARLKSIFAAPSDESRKEPRPVRLPREMIGFEPLRAKAVPGWRYLTSRGATMDHVRKHSIGYCVEGEYANRLIFPVFQGGRPVYFTNRSVNGAMNKSKNPKNVPGVLQGTVSAGL